jgi:hypothetical protein
MNDIATGLNEFCTDAHVIEVLQQTLSSVGFRVQKLSNPKLDYLLNPPSSHNVHGYYYYGYTTMDTLLLLLQLLLLL